MAAYKPVNIISDNTERKNIAFGFDAYAKTIAEVIADNKNCLPSKMTIDVGPTAGRSM